MALLLPLGECKGGSEWGCRYGLWDDSPRQLINELVVDVDMVEDEVVSWDLG